MKVTITRHTGWRPGETQTEGRLTFVIAGANYQFYTLELPWKDNKRRESCIPPGSYEMKKHTSPRFKECFKISSPGKTEVTGRSHILVHPGNTVSDTMGCILPGITESDINFDGKMDVTNSRRALVELLMLLPGECKLEIKNVD